MNNKKTTANRIKLNLLRVYAEKCGFYDLTICEGEQFEYSASEYKIWVSFATDPVFDDFFMRHLVEVHQPQIALPVFLWSFLHELGHAEEDDFLDEEPEYNPMLREILRFADNNQKTADAYFSLVEEYNATNWAVVHAEHHIKELISLQVALDLADTWN
jgi:hypothetical protein